MRKTKIICTLGPAVDDEELLRQLIRSGMDGARFNFSHGTPESHLALLQKLKSVRDNMSRPVATILDTKGPEIRIKAFADGPVTLVKGELFTLTTRDVAGTAEIVSVTYENLHNEVEAGCTILIDDGLVGLRSRARTSCAGSRAAAPCPTTKASTSPALPSICRL